jgi:hypothetical protein
MLLLSLPVSARAATITWQFDGVTTTGAPFPGHPLEALFPVSTPISFTIVLDTSAVDLCDKPGTGLYQMPPSLVTFAGGTFQSVGGGLEVNNPFGNCVAAHPVTEAFQSYVLRLFFASAPFGSASVFWSSFALGEQVPTVPPDSAAFFLGILFASPDITGVINDTSVVPEPSTLMLLGGGLLLTLRRRRSLRP